MQEKYTVPVSTGATLTDPTCCRHCGAKLDFHNSRQKFCNRKCYQEWWSLNVKSKALKLADKVKRDGATNGSAQDDISDADVWAARAQYWQQESDTLSVTTSFDRFQRNDSKPLVITGHGAQLRTERGALLVRDGFTHYPQTRQEWRIYPGRGYLPSRIVLLDTNGYISLEVIQWLCEQRIPLVILDWQGKVVSALGGDGITSDVKLRQAQLAALTNGAGLELVTQLIRYKIAGCLQTLRTLPEYSGKAKAITKIEYALQELSTPVDNPEALRLIEGRAAHAYFGVWQCLPIQWKGTGRHPIPMDWLMVGQRVSLLSGLNRNATHPMNALLNYAYGMLESQVRIAAISAGFDPTVGYLHACRRGRVALIYDLMEPLRPEVDKIMLDLIRSESFTPNDFILTNRGICRLHPQLAKKVASIAVDETRVKEVVDLARLTLLSLTE